MIVADATLIAAFAIRDEESELADAVCAMDADWVAPSLWHSEFRDALVRCMQASGLTLESAMLALQSAEEIMSDREYRVSSARVLELAGRSGCTAFDCEYVALAQDLGVPLVTSDPQLLRAFPKTAVALEKFARKK